jgi:hypothetical protein
MLPSSLVIHRLELCLMASEDSLVGAAGICWNGGCVICAKERHCEDMSIGELSKMISGDAGSLVFLVNFCCRVFSLCCITSEMHTSFSIGESVISMLPSSLVIHRLELCLLASEDKTLVPLVL